VPAAKISMANYLVAWLPGDGFMVTHHHLFAPAPNVNEDSIGVRVGWYLDDFNVDVEIIKVI